MVRRGPVRGPSHLCKQCNQGHRRHGSVVSVQVVRTMHEAVVLIIRRSWVRAPPAPPAVPLQLSAKSWTDVGGPVYRPLTSLVRAARSPARVLPTTASCPAAARTAASPWPRAPSGASTPSCPGPSKQRCGGTGPTGPGRIGPASHPKPPDHLGYFAGRCGQGHRRGPRAALPWGCTCG